MILESLRDLAIRERLLADPDYEPKAVAGILAIDDGGRFLDFIPTTGSDGPGKKPRAKIMQIPRRIGRTSSSAADFLVDKSEYVLGVEPEGNPKPRKPEVLMERLGLFRETVRKALYEATDEALLALHDFLGDDSQRMQAVARITASGYAANDLFAFEYHGQLVHERPAAREYLAKKRRAPDALGVQCLICGCIGPAVEKHPAVQIPGGTTSGIALVSFNSDAFESFGLERNANAPVCKSCADAYTTALKRLLSDRYPDPSNPAISLPKRFVRLSPDTTAIFWSAEESPVIDLLANYFDTPTEESVRELFTAPHTGRVPPSPANRFYCLILSGAQGRAILRGMHTGTVAQVEENIRTYFQSIDIGGDRPLPLWRLMDSIVLQGKRENLPSGLATEVFEAIVFGWRFPRTLLARAVARCIAEQKVTRERAALVRGYLLRNKREWSVSVGLDKDNTNPGYRLGRLLAVLERVQAQAQNNPNKTIVDRYYGSASTRPAVVFPRLLALTQHHLAKLQGGSETFFQKLLGEVTDGITAPMRATLALEEQGQFALGYYHQRQDFFRKAEVAGEVVNENQNGDEE